MEIRCAIIGGTGTGERLFRERGRIMHVPTPEGMLQGKLIEVGDAGVLLIRRHSAGHKLPPHRIRYAALAMGLRQLGVPYCLSTAAVGSLRPEWGPGTFVSCSDFLDLTFRNLTLFHTEVVHRDFSEPFGVGGRKALSEAAASLGAPLHEQGVYVCGNGPRYETPHEIEVFRKLGGDVVGMTASSEAILMREAGIDYACLAIVTNLAAGITLEPLSHEEVVEEMQRSGETAVQLLKAAVGRLR
jgi:5'-methylthioadenosine phosphorylase